MPRSPPVASMGNLTARYVTLKPTAPLPIPPIPAKLSAARKAMSETKPKPHKRGRQVQSNTPAQSNTLDAPSKPAFDKRSYQRDLMRKRRAAKKAKA